MQTTTAPQTDTVYRVTRDGSHPRPLIETYRRNSRRLQAMVNRRNRWASLGRDINWTGRAADKLDRFVDNMSSARAELTDVNGALGSALELEQDSLARLAFLRIMGRPIEQDTVDKLVRARIVINRYLAD